MIKKSLLSKLGSLFAAKQKQLYIAAIAITKDRAAAEDVVLDAMLSVSELEQEPDNLQAYLFRTVRNKALYSTKLAKRFETDIELASLIDSTTLSPEQLVFSRQILRYLEDLESNQQQVLIMKLFGDLTFDEIAEITSNNANTVASWYRRGLEKLKEIVHEPAN